MPMVNTDFDTDADFDVDFDVEFENNSRSFISYILRPAFFADSPLLKCFSHLLPEKYLLPLPKS